MAEKKEKKQEIKTEQPAGAAIPPVDDSPKWIKVTEEQLQDYQNRGKLVGYDPAEKKALVKP
jgi:hypothetical protein